MNKIYQIIVFCTLFQFAIAEPVAHITIDNPYEAGIEITLGINDSISDYLPELNKSHMPFILGDVTYDENEGETDNDVTFTQRYLFYDNLKFTEDYYLQFEYSRPAYEYILNFAQPVEFDISEAKNDIEGSMLDIQETPHYIVDSGFESGIMDRLTLIAGSAILWMAEGETVTKEIDGVDHTIKMIDVANDGDSCGFEIDGTTIWIDVDDMEIFNGVSIAVTEAREVNVKDADADICKVILGANELVLTNNEELEINGLDVFGTNVSLNGMAQSTPGHWTGLRITFAAGGVIEPGDMIIDPLFGNIRINFESIEGANNQLKMEIRTPINESTVIMNTTKLYVHTDEDAICTYRIIKCHSFDNHRSCGGTYYQIMQITGDNKHYQNLTGLTTDSAEYIVHVNCTDGIGNSNTESTYFDVPERDFSTIEHALHSFLFDLDFSIVVGKKAMARDTISATNLALVLQKIIIESYEIVPIPSSIMKLDSEMNDSAYSENIISIGIPSDNSVSAQYVPSKLWPLKNNTGIIALFQHDETATLVVSGNTLNDTHNISRFIQYNPEYLDDVCFIVNTTNNNLIRCDLSHFTDSDNDGIYDDVDRFNHVEFNCNTDVDVLVNDTNATTWQGIGTVRIISNNRTLVKFEHDFNTTLDMTNWFLETESDNIGSLVFSGLEGHTKTLFINNINTNMDHVCIKDAEILKITEISAGCNGADEQLISCDGSNQMGYTCEDIGSEYKITGLQHSGVKESCTDADDDGYATEGGACGDVDCDDSNIEIYPGAGEVKNNVDDNCDGSVDEGFTNKKKRSSGGGSSSRSSSCTETWSCTEWSICNEGLKTRNCTDSNQCDTITNRPIQEQACNNDAVETEFEKTEETNESTDKISDEIIHDNTETSDYNDSEKKEERDNIPTGMAISVDDDGSSGANIFLVLIGVSVIVIALYVYRRQWKRTQKSIK